MNEANALDELLRQFNASTPAPQVPLRPWWDAPVRGLPLEEALRVCAERQGG